MRSILEGILTYVVIRIDVIYLFLKYKTIFHTARSQFSNPQIMWINLILLEDKNYDTVCSLCGMGTLLTT